MPDIFLSGLIENSLQKLAKRWRSDTRLWSEYGDFRGAHHRADLAARLNFSNVVGDYFDGLLAAYATVVESDDYYLREEDLRELAEIQGRGLDIYRQHDTEGSAFVEQVSHPGPDPFKVFHSGAHYERARMT